MSETVRKPRGCWIFTGLDAQKIDGGIETKPRRTAEDRVRSENHLKTKLRAACVETDEGRGAKKFAQVQNLQRQAACREPNYSSTVQKSLMSTRE